MKFLFYSDRSQSCMSLQQLAPWNELSNLFRDEDILFVNIHNPGIYKMIKGRIQFVPSLAIEEGEKVKVIEGNEVINYLSNLIRKRPPPVEKKMEMEPLMSSVEEDDMAQIAESFKVEPPANLPPLPQPHPQTEKQNQPQPPPNQPQPQPPQQNNDEIFGSKMGSKGDFEVEKS